MGQISSVEGSAWQWNAALNPGGRGCNLIEQCATHTSADRVEVDVPQLRHEPLSGELRALYLNDGDAARREAARQGLWVGVAVYLLLFGHRHFADPRCRALHNCRTVRGGRGMAPDPPHTVQWNAATEWLDRTCAAALAISVYRLGVSGDDQLADGELLLLHDLRRHLHDERQSFLQISVSPLSADLRRDAGHHSLLPCISSP